MRWHFGTFQDVHPRARAQNKLTFVYFRSWYSVDCTDFEERVLKDPQVLLETLAMVCVPLDFDYDHPLAEQWQIKKVPAYAIVAPDGQVLVKSQAPLTRDQLLEEIRGAKNWFAAAGRATTAPAPSPP